MKVVREEEKNARLGVRICLEGYHFGEIMRISAKAMTEEEKAAENMHEKIYKEKESRYFCCEEYLKGLK
jgi:hypothetical protein